MKKYLLSPGPTPIPPPVSGALASPILHHRMPAFVDLLNGVIEDLKWLMMTNNDVITLAATATGAMDASFSNFLWKGAKVITISAGKFGQRWAEIARAYGLDLVELEVEWGKAVTIEQIDAVFEQHPDAVALFATASETSTGVAHPIKEIGQYLRDKHPNTLFVVDAVTALAIFEVKTDEWGIDILVGGSQKGLMLPPGLAVMSISPKAWEFNKKSDLPRYYLNVAKEAKSHKKG
jgi:aspartate aminotransferase-like enzyme